MGLNYYDYENHKLEYGDLKPYELKHKIGRGRYSEVYDSMNIYNGQKCVVKVLKPGIFYNFILYFLSSLKESFKRNKSVIKSIRWT